MSAAFHVDIDCVLRNHALSSSPTCFLVILCTFLSTSPSSGLLLLLSERSFGRALEGAGFATAIRELDVPEAVAAERRAQREGSGLKNWQCDEHCQDFFDDLRSAPKYASVQADALMEELRQLLPP